jgi:hypothetical protein
MAQVQTQVAFDEARGAGLPAGGTPAGGAEGSLRDEERTPDQQEEILVWQRDTWGSFGQHRNIYTFVISLETLQTTPIFQLVTVRHVNRDSRKNYHRYTYVPRSELAKLEGCVLKRVEDFASSSKRRINVTYTLVNQGQLEELQAETGLRDARGFYDLVKLPDGRKLVVRKEGVEIA